MSEDVAKYFTFPNFTTSVSETLRKVIDNNTTTGDKNFLNELGMTKVKYGGVSMMLKIRMELAQDYTVFNNITPRP